MIEKLKNCPFCGGEAEVMTDFDSDNKPVKIVSCKKCWSKTTFCGKREQAIQVWNMRKG